MNARFLITALVGLLALSAAHVALNVGWDNFRVKLRVLTGQERNELYVGFLPVT